MMGTTLGPYRVLEKLGEGGMGEVYRAHDTRLGRDVALKVLPELLAGDPERLSRFEREARVLASLNHPHVAQLHGLEESGGHRALVMELVGGETLAERLARGAVPLDEALPVARQLAEALEYAHERGVVHRDLKPANVKLTPEGVVKVLDFGLARAFEGAHADVGPAGSPTITSPTVTRAGVILGTAAYMSPEQARGATVDKRADIWAFGAVLYEMLTGRRCFEGPTVTDVLAAVVKTEPDWSALPAETPERVRDLLRRTLAKDRRQRLHDIGDARVEIEEALAASQDLAKDVSPAPGHARPAATWSRRRALALAGVLSVLSALVAGWMAWHLRPATSVVSGGVVRALLDVGPAEALDAGGYLANVLNAGGSRTALAWTPDDRALVFVGRRGGVRQIYVRPLDQPEARPLAGTDGAQLPVVSADGRWVAFWAGGALKKVPLAGGPVDTLAEHVPHPPQGMAWGPAGLLAEVEHRIAVITPGQPPKAVTTLLDNEVRHSLPQWLPGGTAILYTARNGEFTWGGHRVIAQVVATGDRHVILEDATDARWVAGRLVFLKRGLLLAVGLDPVRLTVRGEPVALVSDVAQALADMNAGDVTGAGQFGVGPAGSLAYVTGPLLSMPDRRLVAVDRRGVVTPASAPARAYTPMVRISPDGKRVLLAVQSLSERALWIHDLDRPGSLTKAGAGGEVGSRVWTPDGERLTFSWISPSGVTEVAWQRADGTGEPERLTDLGYPMQWTPDGRELIGVRPNGEDRDIWVIAHRDGAARVRPIVQSPAWEAFPALSPDGRWLAYVSDVSGRHEVYARPFPGPGQTVQVSLDGGDNVAWHPDGRELFFIGPGDAPGVSRMMVVPIDAHPSLRVGVPRPLFAFRSAELQFASTPLTGFCVARDGQRFFVVQNVPVPPRPPVTQVHLVLNWLEELKAKVPGGE